MTRSAAAPTAEQLYRLFWSWWYDGGGSQGKAALAAARRRGDTEPAEHTEPERWRWGGERWQRLQPADAGQQQE